MEPQSRTRKSSSTLRPGPAPRPWPPMEDVLEVYHWRFRPSNRGHLSIVFASIAAEVSG
jgi:hypothetical protein